MLPRADKAAFFQNIHRLMDEPREIYRALIFERGFPGFHQRRHQANAFREQVSDFFRRTFNHFCLTAAVHPHQAEPAFEAAPETFCQRFIFPVIAVRNRPFQLIGHPLPPAAGLDFFLRTLLLPGFDQQRATRFSIRFEFAYLRRFFAPFLNNL